MPRKPIEIDAKLRQLIYRHYVHGDAIEVLRTALGIDASRTKVYEIVKSAENDFQTIVIPKAKYDPEPVEKLALAVRDAWQEFGLAKVVLVSSPDDDRKLNTTGSPYGGYIRQQLASAAARLVADLKLTDGAHLLVGGGKTLVEVANQIHLSGPRRLVVRPLTVRGHYRAISSNSPEAATVAQLLEARSGGLAMAICPQVLPGMANDPEVRGRPEVLVAFGRNELNEDAEQPQAIVTRIDLARWLTRGGGGKPSPYEQVVGEAVHHRKMRGHFTRADVLQWSDKRWYEDGVEALRDLNVVASLCWHGFDIDGEVVDKASGLLDMMCLRIHPRRIRTWLSSGTTSIVVANGTMGAPLLRTALRGRYFNVLVADVAIAVQLVDPDSTPDAFKHVQKIRDPRETERDRRQTQLKVGS